MSASLLHVISVIVSSLGKLSRLVFASPIGNNEPISKIATNANAKIFPLFNFHSPFKLQNQAKSVYHVLGY
jgi:hypothetical protein